MENRSPISLHLCVCARACTHMLSCVRLFVIPWTVAHQAPLSMGFSRQEHWSRFPFPSPGDLPKPRTETSLASPALADGFFTSWATQEDLSYHVNQFYLKLLPWIFEVLGTTKDNVSQFEKPCFPFSHLYCERKSTEQTHEEPLFLGKGSSHWARP